MNCSIFQTCVTLLYVRTSTFPSKVWPESQSTEASLLAERRHTSRRCRLAPAFVVLHRDRAKCCETVIETAHENDLISRLEPEGSDPQHSRSARRTTLQCMCRSASRGQDVCSVRWSLGRQTTLEHSSDFWKVWSLDFWLVQQQPCYGALDDTQTYTRGVLDAKSLFLHSRDEWISWTMVVPAPG